MKNLIMQIVVTVTINTGFWLYWKPGIHWYSFIGAMFGPLLLGITSSYMRFFDE